MDVKFLFLFGFIMLLVWASVIDFAEYRIPNVLNATLMVAGFMYSTSINNQHFWIVITESLVVFLVLWFFSWGFSRFRGYVGLGLGDVKFIASLTPWVGIVNVPLVIFIASLSGLIFVAVRRGAQNILYSEKLPFAPFLSFSGFLVVLAMIYGDGNLMNFLLYY